MVPHHLYMQCQLALSVCRSQLSQAAWARQYAGQVNSTQATEAICTFGRAPAIPCPQCLACHHPHSEVLHVGTLMPAWQHAWHAATADVAGRAMSLRVQHGSTAAQALLTCWPPPEKPERVLPSSRGDSTMRVAAMPTLMQMCMHTRPASTNCIAQCLGVSACSCKQLHKWAHMPAGCFAEPVQHAYLPEMFRNVQAKSNEATG